MRIGIGYDVHKLTEGRKLILGGVEIPHHMGLEGHSDADVLVHAIMDALLGAAALGDIGKRFPDTDDSYRGISSLKLLSEVGSLLGQEGHAIGNIDATVIAQKPKLRPYIAQMEANVAQTLGISSSQINIKATTEEGLGFTGRKEGISAQAVCILTGLYEESMAVYDSGQDGVPGYSGNINADEPFQECKSCSGCCRK
ncbi:2-C-methyl-D-erythritol 2,4-cyclodiphosphate synthase [Lachnospiraceae bacterium 29-84]